MAERASPWWGPGGHGYAKRIADSGRYKEAQALEICTPAMLGRRCDRPLPEVPVPLKLVNFAVERFKALYPGYNPEPLP
ncbi:hypothetical protein [Sinorhizobium medicae]|uniref:hypothetical protein n=1 Tax=Sinorhizobium medicae TaxID=110321 RepID=UPI002AF6BFD4|nr:hypothetical protein [Sinorhizobium medicae]WQO64503.1 hypothetical protein U8C40_15330 [Sinorhizobium medicae]WQO71602.1 hypothetical protein U8C31_15065 [Sinorhizobium medicae]